MHASIQPAIYPSIHPYIPLYIYIHVLKNTYMYIICMYICIYLKNVSSICTVYIYIMYMMKSLDMSWIDVQVMLIHSIWESVAFDPTTGTSIVQGRICHTDDPYDFCEGFARNSVHFPPHQWVEKNTNLYISYLDLIFFRWLETNKLKKFSAAIRCLLDSSWRVPSEERKPEKSPVELRWIPRRRGCQKLEVSKIPTWWIMSG